MATRTIARRASGRLAPTTLALLFLALALPASDAVAQSAKDLVGSWTLVSLDNPHWGRYSINAADRIILFQIDHATFANWEGTEQKRSFTLTGDELKYSVPNPSATGANPVVVWKRAK